MFASLGKHIWISRDTNVYSPLDPLLSDSYQSELSLVRSLVEGVVKELIISASSSESVKRALLGHGARLAGLFGRRDLNDKVWDWWGIRLDELDFSSLPQLMAPPFKFSYTLLKLPQVLPLLITCLNSPSRALRTAFFKAVSQIGPHTGRESLDVFLLPCLEQVSLDHRQRRDGKVKGLNHKQIR